VIKKLSLVLVLFLLVGCFESPPPEVVEPKPIVAEQPASPTQMQELVETNTTGEEDLCGPEDSKFSCSNFPPRQVLVAILTALLNVLK